MSRARLGPDSSGPQGNCLAGSCVVVLTATIIYMQQTKGQCTLFSYQTTSRAYTRQKGGHNMPRGDGTGPQGMGPMTGRGLGYCAGYATPGFANPVGGGLGRGMAWGRGGGGGRGLALRRGRGGFQPPYAGFVPPAAGVFSPAMPDEETVLKSHVSALEEQLAAVKARLGEIEGSRTSD